MDEKSTVYQRKQQTAPKSGWVFCGCLFQEQVIVGDSRHNNGLTSLPTRRRLSTFTTVTSVGDTCTATFPPAGRAPQEGYVSPVFKHELPCTQTGSQGRVMPRTPGPPHIVVLRPTDPPRPHPPLLAQHISAHRAFIPSPDGVFLPPPDGASGASLRAGAASAQISIRHPPTSP